MAVRIYHNFSAPKISNSAPAADAIKPGQRQSRPPERGAKTRGSHIDEAHNDTHIIERKVKKENRAGRRELEAARRQLKAMREDHFHEEDDI